MYELGIGIGILALVIKVLSFYYLTGGKKQWKVKYLTLASFFSLIFLQFNYWFAIIPISILAYFLFIIPSDEKEMGVRTWIKKSPTRQGMLITSSYVL